MLRPSLSIKFLRFVTAGLPPPWLPPTASGPWPLEADYICVCQYLLGRFVIFFGGGRKIHNLSHSGGGALSRACESGTFVRRITSQNPGIGSVAAIYDRRSH